VACNSKKSRFPKLTRSFSIEIAKMTTVQKWTECVSEIRSSAAEQRWRCGVLPDIETDKY